MSELINNQNSTGHVRRNLLANASLLALLGAVCMPPATAAADENRPTVWIELGGQLERVDTPQAIFAPPFFDFANPAVLGAMVDSQRPSRYSQGLEGKISFEPSGTNWVFSAALRYGQSKNDRHLHYETPGLPSFTESLTAKNSNTIVPSKRNFGDGQTDSAKSDFVIDFQAGKDIGLGLFGGDASSIVSVGVRYAQFTSRANTAIHARPVVGYSAPVMTTILKYHGTIRHAYGRTYTAVLHTTRNTHAIGPSLSWGASLPVLGKPDAMTVTFDWGMSGAVLFGRQRTLEEHNTNGRNNYNVGKVGHSVSYAHSTAGERSRAMTIPNVGGFAGVSLKFPNAKVSLGYRGDFFFNATDSGIDARNAANQNFYGPFATISIGFP